MDNLSTLLENARQEANSDSIAHTGNSWCTTIEGQDASEPDRPIWIQLHDGLINFSYYDSSEPVGALRAKGIELPEKAGEPDFESQLYCTFEIAALPDPEITDLVATILTKYHGLAADSELSASLEDMG